MTTHKFGGSGSCGNRGWNEYSLPDLITNGKSTKKSPNVLLLNDKFLHNQVREAKKMEERKTTKRYPNPLDQALFVAFGN